MRLAFKANTILLFGIHILIIDDPIGENPLLRGGHDLNLAPKS